MANATLSCDDTSPASTKVQALLVTITPDPEIPREQVPQALRAAHDDVADLFDDHDLGVPVSFTGSRLVSMVFLLSGHGLNGLDGFDDFVENALNLMLGGTGVRVHCGLCAESSAAPIGRALSFLLALGDETPALPQIQEVQAEDVVRVFLDILETMTGVDDAESGS